MKDLFLIYIHEIGDDYKGCNIYEFIFSDTTKDLDGDDWDKYPASSASPSPPHERFIKEVGKLETSTLKLDVVQKSDTFAIWDSLDNVVALGWENINDYETYPAKRLSFRFGETFEDVKNKLYEKDLILDLKYNKVKNEK